MFKFSPMDHESAREQVDWSLDEHQVIFPYTPVQTKKRYSVPRRIVERSSWKLDANVNLQVVTSVTYEQMSLYHIAADVLRLPLHREGSPNTVKESKAYNMPVVSTNVRDVKRRLGPVSNSYVCSDNSELEDALVSVLKPGDRSDGREYVMDVSLERMGERIVSICESLLGITSVAGKITPRIESLIV